MPVDLDKFANSLDSALWWSRQARGCAPEIATAVRESLELRRRGRLVVRGDPRPQCMNSIGVFVGDCNELLRRDSPLTDDELNCLLTIARLAGIETMHSVRDLRTV